MADVIVRLRPDQVEPLDRFAAEASRSRSNAAQWLIDQALQRQSEPVKQEDA